ncbi:hypothetical protein M422DRAFT_59392 [Sphaerobolus stellatus SS14]|nr:hypothetical protein M422DRAFT_59392 [Sphaerobolus stellatus SS14]
MKALVTATGNTAIVTDVFIPEPRPNEIRVKVISIGINPVDPLYVAHPNDKPGRVVGSDIAGIIDKVGYNVPNWKVGDRVAGLLQGATSVNPRPGGFAQYVILEDDLVIHIPDAVSFDEAATYPLCSLTAAQALFIRLEIPAPFPGSPFQFHPPLYASPALLIYGASTSLGLFTLGLAKNLRTPLGESYRIYVTASPRNHLLLLSLGATEAFDYRDTSWPSKVKKASGGIHFAVDCISEDKTTARISQTFADDGGKIAVIRKSAWKKEGVRKDVVPIYGAAWAGLGYPIWYNDELLPASPSWRSLTVAFFSYLSAGSPSDPTKFPIEPNPVRLMPGGLECVVQDAFTLMGSGKVAERRTETKGAEKWMRPISAEKLVYRIESEESIKT